MDEVTLRDYKPGDWARMHALDVQCFAPAFQFSRRAMRSFAEAPGALTVLAEAADELVGFCLVQIEGKVGYVITLDVAAAWRRRGLARRMMEDLEARVRAAGGAAMALHVYTENAEAMRFYESMGYGRVGRVEGFYGRGLDALLYRKRLGT
jgi:ribosomal-protein-alanine N-acetyltransferase